MASWGLVKKTSRHKVPSSSTQRYFLEIKATHRTGNRKFHFPALWRIFIGLKTEEEGNFGSSKQKIDYKPVKAFQQVAQ